MSKTKQSVLDALANASVEDGDTVILLDISDTTMAATGTQVEVTLKTFVEYIIGQEIELGNWTFTANQIIVDGDSAMIKQSGLLVIGGSFTYIDFADATLFNPMATPGTPVEGMVYFDSTSKKLRVYNGSGWDDLN